MRFSRGFGFSRRPITKNVSEQNAKAIQMFKQIILITYINGIFGNLFGQKKHTENFESYIRIINNQKVLLSIQV
jgi:hypothetical protein